MSQTKGVPVLKIRQKNLESDHSKVAVGANCEVFLDDQKLRSLHFLKLEIKAAKVVKVTMEMYVQLDVELPIEEPKEIKTEPVEGYEWDGKPLAIRTLGNYSPVGHAIKPTK